MKLSGEKLREIRVKRGFSQEALAHRAGFAVRTLRRLEQGKSQPQPATLKALADSLSVQVEELCRTTVVQHGTPPQLATSEAGSGVLFVGRRDLCHRLESSLLASRSECGHVVVLCGEPGIGKTATAEWLLRRTASQGIEVYRGQCLDTAGAPPSWPWVQVLRALQSRRKPEPDFAETIARLLPESADPSASPGSSLDERFLAFDAVARGLAERSRKVPFALLIEDLHWADSATTLLFELVAREAAHAPLLLIGTVRDHELERGHAAVSLLGNLARMDHCKREALEGLDLADAEELVSALTDARPQPIEMLVRRTGGNPFFLCEVLRAPRSDADASVPASVRDSLRVRWEQLTSSTRDVLEIVAMVGDHCRLDDLVAISGHEPELVEDSLAAAQRAGFVRSKGNETIGYPHALIREMVLGEVPSSKRVRLHRMIGQAIEGLDRGDFDSRLPELAHHFGQAIPGGDVTVAIDYAIRAALYAVSLLGFDDSLRWSGLALAWADAAGEADPGLRCRALLARATACACNGNVVESRAAYESAARVSEEIGDPVTFAMATIGFNGDSETNAGPDPEALALLERARLKIAVLPQRVRAELELALASRLGIHERFPEARSLAASAWDRAERLADAPLRAKARLTQFSLTWSPRDTPSDRLILANDALECAIEGRDPRLTARAQVRILLSLLELGQLERADRVAVDLEESIRRGGEAMMPYRLNFRIACAHLDGRFVDADALANELRALTSSMHDLTALTMLSGHDFERKRIAGRLDDQHVDRVFEGIRAGRVPTLMGFTSAHVLAVAGRFDEGRWLLEEARRPGRVAHLPGRTYALCSLALLAIALEDRTHCEALYRELEPYEGLWVVKSGNVWTSFGPVSRYRGLLAAALVDSINADRHLRNAVEQCQKLPSAPWLAQAQLDLAGWLAVSTDEAGRQEAVALARASRDTAFRLGMTALCTEARSAAAEISGGEAA